MANYTSTNSFYSPFKLALGAGYNLSTNAFDFGLVTSSYTPNAEHEDIADITNELSGSGYSRQTITTPTWTRSTTTAKLSGDDIVFTASGGSLTARRWFMRNSTVDSLMMYGLIDDTNADVVTTDGNSLTFEVGTDGFFLLS